MKLSICCITYNQEKYIAQTLDGMLCQKTNFDFEILIGEDHSTDNTSNIILTYQQKYPDRITLLPLNKNIGVRKNFAKTLLAATGEYVAICEGDDYWTDTLKLQKQVDYLDANSDTDICFHNTQIYYENTGKMEQSNNANQPIVTNIKDLIANWYIMTCSIVYRRNFAILPDWFTSVFNTDYALQMLITAKGSKIAYLKDEMAVYRKHSEGESAKVWGDDSYYWLLFMFDKLNVTTNKKYELEINARKIEIINTLAFFYDNKVSETKNISKKIKFFCRYFFMKINMPLYYYNKFLKRKNISL